MQISTLEYPYKTLVMRMGEDTSGNVYYSEYDERYTAPIRTWVERKEVDHSSGTFKIVTERLYNG